MKFCYFSFFVLIYFVDGVLSERVVSCSLPKVKNGRIRSRQRGRVIKFVCQPGFQLAGERNAFCINGTWDMPTPKCVRTTCPKKDTPPANGLILPSHGGGVLNFYCKQGYELHGPVAVFCDGFAWDNQMPSCIPSNTKPSLFCDFEDPNICHWTHDLNHDMDWKRDSYKTPTGYSMETGPSYDHTKGKGSNGYYMYIESSSRRMNDTARLISPIFDKTTANTCLEFWYHMYGRTTGTLRAYMKKVTDPWPLDSENALFSKTGNQGNVWYNTIVNLGVVDENYQIVIEGVRGNGYVSDTAIDDIRIIENCTYEDYVWSTTEVPLPVSEILKTVETCENRCGSKASGNDGPQIISCDCDDYCYENSRCCPDFVDFCFTSVSTTESETTIELQITSEKLPIPSNSTVKNTTIERKLLKSTATPQKITQVFLTTFPPAEKKLVVSRKPLIPIALPTKPRLIIVSRPNATAIYQKFLPNNPKGPQNKNNSKISFVKPIMKTTPSTAGNKNVYDVIDVPTKQDFDEVLFITSPVPVKDDNNIPLQDKEKYVEKVSEEKKFLENNDFYPENLGESKVEFRQSQSEMSNVKLIFVIIATLCGIATIAIVSTVVVIKYRVLRWRNRRMMSGNGDSQSDVRFLTADEVLDFNLDNDDL